MENPLQAVTGHLASRDVRGNGKQTGTTEQLKGYKMLKIFRASVGFRVSNVNFSRGERTEN